MRTMLVVFVMVLGLSIAYGTRPAMTTEYEYGRALVAERCTTCHNIDRIERRFGQGLAFWESTVDRMLGKRNMLNDAERRLVLDYLTDP